MTQTQNATRIHRNQLLKFVASACDARKRCIKNGNQFALKWDSQLDSIEKLLPYGSGFDRGTRIDREASGTQRVVFTTSFHHTDDNGSYCGWSDHTVTAEPDLALGFTLKISGRNVRDIKDYIADVFSDAARIEIQWDAETETWREVPREVWVAEVPQQAPAPIVSRCELVLL